METIQRTRCRRAREVTASKSWWFISGKDSWATFGDENSSSPTDSLDAGDVIEVTVLGKDGHVVLTGEGGDPEVVGRDGAAPFL